MPDSENLEPLFSVIMDAIPAPEYTDGAPLQAHVTNLDASPYLGRLALCRVINGTLRRGQNGGLVQGGRQHHQRPAVGAADDPRTGAAPRGRGGSGRHRGDRRHSRHHDR